MKPIKLLLTDNVDNLGIVGLEVRRSYERPEVLSVFARVRNFGSEPAESDVSLVLEDRVADVRALSLEPGRYAAGAAAGDEAATAGTEPATTQASNSGIGGPRSRPLAFTCPAAWQAIQVPC